PHAGRVPVHVHRALDGLEDQALALGEAGVAVRGGPARQLELLALRPAHSLDLFLEATGPRPAPATLLLRSHRRSPPMPDGFRHLCFSRFEGCDAELCPCLLIDSSA